MHTLVGLDVDPVARATASARLAGVVEARRAAGGGAEAAAGGASPLSLHIRAANFRTLAAELGAVGCGDADGILLDLGFSSMQASVVWREREKAEAEGRREERGVGCGSARLSISDLFFFSLIIPPKNTTQIDDPARGFALSKDGPLDMRMADPAHPLGSISAAEIVNAWPEADLAALLWEAGEERAARTVAARLVAARAVAPINTTGELVAALGLAGWKKRGGGGGGGKGGRAAAQVHPATRVFQALRIGANDELGALADALPAALGALAPGGRLAVISFHSLEDRAVKRAFLRAAGKGGGGSGEEGEEEGGGGAFSGGGGRWERAARVAWGAAPPPPPPDPTVRILTRRPLTATPAEVAANPRARSAKLRVVERL
jgi:16S rRNA (cytosine1402-N4)-methyltransferase